MVAGKSAHISFDQNSCFYGRYHMKVHCTQSTSANFVSSTICKQKDIEGVFYSVAVSQGGG